MLCSTICYHLFNFLGWPHSVYSSKFSISRDIRAETWGRGERGVSKHTAAKMSKVVVASAVVQFVHTSPDYYCPVCSNLLLEGFLTKCAWSSFVLQLLLPYSPSSSTLTNMSL